MPNVQLTKEDILYAAEVAENYPPGFAPYWGLDSSGNGASSIDDVVPGRG